MPVITGGRSIGPANSPIAEISTPSAIRIPPEIVSIVSFFICPYTPAASAFNFSV